MLPLLLLLCACTLTGAIDADWAARVAALDALYCPDDTGPIRPETGYPANILLPLMGNGYLGHDKGVRSDTMYVSGIFNNETTSPAHRARIPATLAVTIDSAVNTSGALLDMRHGTYARRGALDEAGSMYELRWYAHRIMHHLYVMELEVHLAESVPSITLQLTNNAGSESVDFDFVDIIADENIALSCGTTTVPETPSADTQVVCVAHTPVPAQLTLSQKDSGKTRTFITAISTSLDEPDNGATSISSLSKSAYQYLEAGLALAEENEGAVLAAHKAGWSHLWMHGISISGGRDDVALAINASLFAILSSVRDDWPEGLAPGGLTNNYNGHSFWDTETWMYPPILMLHADIAEGLIQYRYNRLDGAEAKALSYDPPFAGTMFPWESAATGVETCPDWAPTGAREQHISADISLATWQYWLMQRDERWLESVGNPILQGVAKFLVSKAVVGEEDAKAHINDVIPPDEYVDHVNDSVYTNYVASRALYNAVQAGKKLGSITESDAATYTRFAEDLVILFNETLGIHPEYEGYGGAKVKQADVVLLHYPLGMDMTSEVLRADLDYYSKRTDPAGPAMTWGMHSIGYRDLLDLDLAALYFDKSFSDNINKPFNVWSEGVNGANAGNFITGAGGFLQTVLSGYANIRITACGDISFSPLCILGSSGLTVRGFSYIGSSMDISLSCNDESNPSYPTEVAVTMTASSTTTLYLSSSTTDSVKALIIGSPEIFNLSASGAAASAPVSFSISPDSTRTSAHQ